MGEATGRLQNGVSANASVRRGESKPEETSSQQRRNGKETEGMGDLQKKGSGLEGSGLF